MASIVIRIQKLHGKEWGDVNGIHHTGGHNNGNVERTRLAAEAQPNNRKTHGMNSIPFGQCGICPAMYILLSSPLYLITKNGVQKDIKFELMEEFG